MVMHVSNLEPGRPEGSRSDAEALAAAFPDLWAEMIASLGPDPSWSPMAMWLFGQLQQARAQARRDGPPDAVAVDMREWEANEHDLPRNERFTRRSRR